MYENNFFKKNDIRYLEIIIKVVLSKMVFFMVDLHLCSILIFHCIEVRDGVFLHF